MKNTPIERHLIDETINEFQIVDFSKATIREVKAIASKAEAASGVEFIFKIPKAEWESACTGIAVSFNINHDLFGGNFQTLCYSSDNALISLMGNHPVDIVFA